MQPLRLIALSAALLAGTAVAHAQTVTRQITTEPVETIVTQQPDGSTVVTRRPIGDQAGDLLPAPPVRYAPIAAPLRAQENYQETYVEPAIAEPATVGVRTTTTNTRRTTTRRVTSVRRPEAVPRARTARTVTRTRAPLALTPTERRIVYQTIVRRDVYPGVAVQPAPIVAPAAAPVYETYGGPVYRSYDTYDSTYAAPPVVAETEVIERPPAVVGYPATTGYAPRAYSTSYVVGSHLPASVPLVAVPETVAARVPAVRDYSYVVVGGRVYLVDPATSTVVADITGQY